MSCIVNQPSVHKGVYMKLLLVLSPPNMARVFRARRWSEVSRVCYFQIVLTSTVTVSHSFQIATWRIARILIRKTFRAPFLSPCGDWQTLTSNRKYVREKWHSNDVSNSVVCTELPIFDDDYSHSVWYSPPSTDYSYNYSNDTAILHP